MYDYLVVGSGLFGAIFAHEATKREKKVLVIDKRNHIAGNIYTENKDEINIHKYGAHIFHTSNKEVWQYINKLHSCQCMYYNKQIFYKKTTPKQN